MAIFNSPQHENGIVANRVQADLRDAGGLVLDHHNKADIIIKSPKFFFFLSACNRYVYIILYVYAVY